MFEYMHNKNIIYRDLKPENLLIESQKGKMFLKIADLGFATVFDKDKKMVEQVGTPLYIAPEITLNAKYDSKVDIWSLGVITYILLSGDPPFMTRSKDELYHLIQAGDY